MPRVMSTAERLNMLVAVMSAAIGFILFALFGEHLAAFIAFGMAAVGYLLLGLQVLVRRSRRA